MELLGTGRGFKAAAPIAETLGEVAGPRFLYSGLLENRSGPVLFLSSGVLSLAGRSDRMSFVVTCHFSPAALRPDDLRILNIFQMLHFR